MKEGMMGCHGWRKGWWGAVDEGRDNGVPWMEEGAAVAGEILIHLTLGNIHSFSIFFLSICTNCFSRNPLPKYMIWVISSGNMMTYMASYMRDRIDQSKGYPNFIWVFCIGTTAQVGSDIYEFCVWRIILKKCIYNNNNICHDPPLFATPIHKLLYHFFSCRAYLWYVDY